MSGSDRFPPSIEVTRLFEKTSERGTRYMIGRLGGARIALLPGDAAEDGTPTWRLLLQAAPPRTEAAAPPAGRSSRAYATRRPPYPARSPVRPDSVSLPDDVISDIGQGDP